MRRQNEQCLKMKKIKEYIVIFILSLYSVKAQYNSTTLIGYTNWFNFDAFNPSTTSGIFAFFFLVMVFMGCIAISEITQIPALAVITGVLGFFIGILLLTSISVIIGIIVMIVSIIYIFRGALMSR